MKLIKRVILGLFALVALIIGILFSKRNSQPVEVDILVAQLPPISVSVWILLSFILGVIVSGLLFSVLNQVQKRHTTRLTRQLSQLAATQSESR